LPRQKRRGSLRHLRRHVAPSFWPIHRKEYAWAVKPRAGPHPLYRSLPLGVVLRDMLGYARNMREARKILSWRKVEVDGRIITDYKFPVGLMDVIHIIPTDEYYRVVSHPVKFFTLHPISEEEASYKLLRIIRKQYVRGKAIQLTFHDGRNYLITLKDVFNPVEAASYSTYDVVKMTIPKQSIEDHVKFEPGVWALIIDGSHVGFYGKIEDINVIFKRSRAIVTLKSPSGEVRRTILEYVFPVGREKPLISLPVEVTGSAQ